MLLLETHWIEPVFIISSMLSIMMMMLLEGSLCTLEDFWSIIMMERRMAILVVVVVIRIVLMRMVVMMMMMIEGGPCDVVGNIRGMFHGECLTILRQPMISIAGRICDYATKQSDWVSNIFHLRE